ncbi:MAG: 50S ribosomal protein L6, partial [Sulfolobales archaeon]|nr:50S ribosomal protein L6 [Sulfolobales archaeon]
MVRAVKLREEIPIPSGVNVEIDGRKVRVRGPKGVVEKDFGYARGVVIAREGESIVFEAYFADRRAKAQLYSL